MENNVLEKEKNHLKYTALRKIIFIREADTRATERFFSLRVRIERRNHDGYIQTTYSEPGVYNKVKCAAVSRGLATVREARAPSSYKNKKVVRQKNNKQNRQHGVRHPSRFQIAIYTNIPCRVGSRTWSTETMSKATALQRVGGV